MHELGMDPFSLFFMIIFDFVVVDDDV